MTSSMRNKEIITNLLYPLASTPEGRVSQLLNRLSSESENDNGEAFYEMYECTRDRALIALTSLLKHYV